MRASWLGHARVRAGALYVLILPRRVVQTPSNYSHTYSIFLRPRGLPFGADRTPERPLRPGFHELLTLLEIGIWENMYPPEIDER